jgi:hypothetical protein
MSMTREASQLHEQYEAADSVVRQAVDDAYKAARVALESAGFDVDNSDPAEEFVAAIFKYVIDSALPTVKHTHSYTCIDASGRCTVTGEV